jgi:hypothetical protein
MRTRLRREVGIGAPAAAVWDYVTDWPAQAEWIPLTRVERVDAADRVGGRLRAWTGLGPVGFWDPMTITTWERSPDGGGVCEVLHTGRVVRGEGEFRVEADGPGRSRFVWSETLELPAGALGAAGWRVAGPAGTRLVARALERLRTRLEASAPGFRPPS